MYINYEHSSICYNRCSNLIKPENRFRPRVRDNKGRKNKKFKLINEEK